MQTARHFKLSLFVSSGFALPKLGNGETGSAWFLLFRFELEDWLGILDVVEDLGLVVVLTPVLWVPYWPT